MASTLNVGDLVVHIRANAEQFHSGMNKVEQTMRSVTQNITRLGKIMSVAITAPVLLATKKSISAFKSFDDAMTQSVAIMGDISEEMRTQLEETAITMSTTSIKSAEELAKSYFFLTSAGFSVEQSLASIEHVQKFAVAGMFKMAKATDLLTDAQSAMGLTVKDTAKNTENLIHVSDVLVKANTLANATVEQFSRSLVAKAGASLKIVNKDIEEGVAVLAAFADQGIKAELAGERLAIVMRDIQTSSFGKKGKPPWEELGLSAWTAAGKMRPLVEIIEMFEDRMDGMSDKERKLLLLQAGFQDRSVIAMQSLIGFSKRIREYEVALRQAGGTTEEVAEKQLTSFASKILIIKNRIMKVAIEIGRMLAPALDTIAKKIDEVIEWWDSLDESQKKSKLSLVAMAAAVGPALIVFGKIAGMAASMISVTGLIVAATAALIGKQGFVSAWEKVKEVVGFLAVETPHFLENFQSNMTVLFEWLQKSWETVFTNIGKVVLKIWDNVMHNFIVAVMPMLTSLGAVFKGFFREVWGTFSNILSLTFATTQKEFDAKLAEMFDFNRILDDYEKAVGAPSTKLRGLTEGIGKKGFLTPLTLPNFDFTTREQKGLIVTLAREFAKGQRLGNTKFAEKMIAVETEKAGLTVDMLDKVFALAEERNKRMADDWATTMAESLSTTKESMASLLKREEEKGVPLVEAMNRLTAAFENRARALELQENRRAQAANALTPQASTSPAPGDVRTASGSPVQMEIVNTMDPELISAAATATAAGKKRILNILGANLLSGGPIRRQLRMGVGA